MSTPEQKVAHRAVAQALVRGGLIKPDDCSCCGEPTPHFRLHGHHHDYSKPLEVQWVCPRCHSAIHLDLLTLDDAV